MNKNILWIAGGLFSINILGYLLKIFELPAFFILLGFRFHLCSIVFLLLLFLFRKEIEIKKHLTDADFKNSWRTSLAFVPVLILAAGAYFMRMIKFEEPDFFYELGLSSLVDFPIYLVWNLPQFTLLFLFFNLVSNLFGKKIIFLLSPLLFLYEMAPLPDSEFDWLRAAEIFSSSIFVAFLFLKEKNIYIHSVAAFTLFWLIVLIYGSDDATITKIFLASTYTSWDGFFKAENSSAMYISLSSIILAWTVAFKKDNRL